MFTDLKVAFFLAYRAIRRGSRGTLIFTLMIMTLSVINLVFMPSLLNSVNSTIGQQVIDTRFGNVVIQPQDKNEFINDPSQVIGEISSMKEVYAYSVQYSRSGSFTFKGITKSFPIHFIDPSNEALVTNIEDNIMEGDFLSRLDTDEIIIGSEVSGTYDASFAETSSLKGVVAGDYVDVIHVNGVKKRYRVKGIFNTGYINSDLNVYMNEKELENVYGLKLDDVASNIMIKLNQDNNEDEFIRKLYSLGISDKIKKSLDLSGMDLAEAFSIINSILTIVALLVSMTTLFIVIYINAINKRKLIAIIKAIGIKRRIIILSFIFQSLFYATVGVIFGFLIIYFGLVPYFAANPLQMPMGDVSLSVYLDKVIPQILLFLGFSMITGFVPAYQVARRNIIETMRS